MSAMENDKSPNASQASIASNPADEGEAAYPTPTAPESNGPAADNPAVPAQESQDDTSAEQPGQAKRNSLADKAKAGFAMFQNKIKGIGGSGNNENKNNAESQDEKEKEKAKADPSRLSMEGLLKQARISFEKWVDAQNPKDYPMPHGIVFLTSIKGSFGWGGEVGTGLVFYRLNEDDVADDDKNKDNNNKNDDKKNGSNDDLNAEGKVDENKENNNDEKKKKKKKRNRNGIRWSGPCAIGSGGVSFGLQIGISKVDHIVMLPRRDHVRTFTSKGQFKLGGSTELTVVNVGGKAQGSVNIGDKEMSDIHSYSLDTKGLSAGISIEGAVISVRGDCNSSFYGVKTTVEDIAYGRAKAPEPTENEDYDRIVELLNKHFKIYRRHGPLGPHHGPHGGPPIAPIVPAVAAAAVVAPMVAHGPGPRGGGPLVGAALGVVGALALGPHGPHGGPHHHHGPHGGHRGGHRGGHH